MIHLPIAPDLDAHPMVPATVTQPGALVDGCGRVVNHLRLSVTSACNLDCAYCRPSKSSAQPHRDMTDRQRIELVRFMVEFCGLKSLRLTGGEPLLHPNIVGLIRELRVNSPRLSIAMTTNGWRLASLAKSLRTAGLDRLNVSLDSIDPIQYRSLTGGELAPVIAGIEAARKAGFPPPRLNAVVLAGLNDHKLIEMAAWSITRNMEIRFLEAMPIGPAAEFNRQHFVSADGMIDRLRAGFNLESFEQAPGETAVRFRLRSPELQGTVGIIAPVSRPFCGHCRRVRLTSDGRLFPCLLDPRYRSIRPAWMEGSLDPRLLMSILESAILEKPPTGAADQTTSMVSLGG